MSKRARRRNHRPAAPKTKKPIRGHPAAGHLSPKPPADPERLLLDQVANGALDHSLHASPTPSTRASTCCTPFRPPPRWPSGASATRSASTTASNPATSTAPRPRRRARRPHRDRLPARTPAPGQLADGEALAPSVIRRLCCDSSHVALPAPGPHDRRRPPHPLVPVRAAPRAAGPRPRLPLPRLPAHPSACRRSSWVLPRSIRAWQARARR